MRSTCGGKQFRVLVESVEDGLELRDELDAVGTNREAEMTLESLTRTDGRRSVASMTRAIKQSPGVRPSY